ncbi:MAG: hypothetical protein KDB18_12940, partial [Salinibacterium sp.]|nr:hypothetical protein [Salinibacterium sp.]
LAPSASDRYPSALELKEDLRRYLAGKRVRARRPRHTAPAARQQAGADFSLAWIVKPLAFIVLLGGFAWFTYRQLDFPSLLGQVTSVGSDAVIDVEPGAPTTSLRVDTAPPTASQPQSQTPPPSSAPTAEEYAELELLLAESTGLGSVTITSDLPRRTLRISGVVLNTDERQRVWAVSRQFRDRHWPTLSEVVLALDVRPSQIEQALEQWLVAQGDRASTVRAFSNKLFIRRDPASPLSAEAIRGQALRYVSDPVLVQVD